MFGKKKTKPQIDQEQLALIQNAQRRIKQKKRFYSHIIVFVIAAILLITANIILGIGKHFRPLDIDWFVYPIAIWLFFLMYHFFNVFVTNKFMGADWEKEQLDKLVSKQKIRIEKLKNQLAKEDLHIAKSDVFNKQQTKTIKNLTLIVAAGENNEIGKDNDLIWHLRDDLKRFKSLTSGHHIIMGRKTFESFPKPLPNRTHIVISRQTNYQVPEGVQVVNSIEDALIIAKTDNQPFIIGGGEIYKQAMAFAEKIELTRVHATFNADTFFPEIDTTVWKETESEIHSQDENHKYAFSFITYKRK